jgi:nitroimidazol reductase NimA-like FMN-containing flavoprotein (pyridoxamine 5'-phosphate oxidase superfamily)
MPGYGIPESGEGMLPWSYVTERLERARNYWICTTRPDGRPHAAPVWGVWVDGALYFGTGPRTRKARNLAANRAIVVHLESGDDVVILEGIAEELDDVAPALFARIADASAAKYQERPEDASGMFAVRIRAAYAWHNFPKDATRWVFPAQE